MDNLEITAKTVEEATQKALAIFNLDLDKLDITVLDEGRSGILGLGSADARISVKVRQSEEVESGDSFQEVRRIVQTLLDKMGLRVSVNVFVPRQAVDEDGVANPVVLNITGPDSSILVGRRGQTIDAFQYIVRLILTRQTRSRLPIMIDVEGYKQKRYEDLRTMAMNVAEQVKSRRSSVRLEPMSPYERRIVHMALADDPEVLTESIGEGESRKVVVYPKHLR